MFAESDCVSIEYLRQLRDTADEPDYSDLDRLLVEMDKAVAELPEVTLPEATARFIRQGQPVIVRHLPQGGLVRLYEGTRFIGIGDILDDGRVAPRRMIVD